MKWKRSTVLFATIVLTGCGIRGGENLSKEPVKQVAEENAMDETELYEQFLQGEFSAVMGEKYSSSLSYGFYSTYRLGEREIYTLEEMEQEVADDYLHPKWPGAVYDPEAVCAGIQYAYVDNMDGEGKTLLLRFDFEETDISHLYTYNTPVYTVVVLAAEDGRLSVIGQYDNTVDNKITAYENGLLYAYWPGNWNTASSVHALLSNGRCECIYGRESLSGKGIYVWKWDSDLGYDIYEEVFATEQELLETGHFLVEITTIYGDDSANYYYRYDMDECTEQEKEVCEIFVNKCREETSVTWMTAEEVQRAVADRCNELGFDSGDMLELAEVVWIKL